MAQVQIRNETRNEICLEILMLKTTELNISLRLCLKQEDILMDKREMWFEIEMGEDCKNPITVDV